MWVLFNIILHGFVALLLFLFAYVTYWNSRRFWDFRTAMFDAIVSLVASVALITLAWSWGQLYVIALAVGILRGQHEPAPRLLPRHEGTKS